MKRPVVCAAVALVAGVYAGAAGLPWGWPLPVAVLGSAFALGVFGENRPRLRAPAVLLAFFAAGALLWQARCAGPPGDNLSRHVLARGEGRHALEGRVSRPGMLLPGEDRLGFILNADRVEHNGAVVPGAWGRTYVAWSGAGEPVFAGERVRVEGNLRPIISRVNPGVWGSEDRHRLRGVHTSMAIRGPGGVRTLRDAPWWWPPYWASRLRRAEAVRLQRVVPADAYDFVRAIWLGDRASLSDDAYDHFVRSGTAHILAVSGVHAGIVYVSMSLVLGMAVRNCRARAVATMAAVFLFAMVAGARVTTVRAAVMVAVYLLAEFWDRDPDAPTALGISALIFTFANPRILFDRGFLLSFTSVASILLFSEPIKARLRALPRALRTSAGAALSVQILPLPLALHYFHVFPVFAPVANLVVVPLLAVALWLCMAATIAAFTWQAPALLFGHALGPVVGLIRGTAAFVGGLRFSHLRVTSPTVVAMGLLWAAGLALYLALTSRPGHIRAGHRYVPRRAIPAAASLALLAAAALFWNPWRPEAMVTFLDVGHGDAAFVRVPGGATMLIDGGATSPYHDTGRRIVGPFLRSRHVSRLDYVVLTHPHLDHAGGLRYVLEHFDVGAFVLGPRPTSMETEAALLDTCARRGIPVRRVARGDLLPFGGTSLEVLHPPRQWAPPSLNDDSVVLRLEWPGGGVLFTGDIEAAGERLLAGTARPATVLKVPHHGSATSTSQALLDRVAPEHCVIPTGGPGGRSPIDPGVVARCGARAEVWRTDHAGGVTLRVREGRPVIESARIRNSYLPRLPSPVPAVRP